MKNRFVISEEEKSRILGLHETAKSQHGTVLNEQHMGVAFGNEPNGLKIKKVEATEQTAPVKKPNQFCPKIVPSPSPTDWNKVKAEIGKYQANKSGESVYIPSYPTTFFVSNNTGYLGNAEAPEQRTTGGIWSLYQIKNTWGPDKLFCVPKIKKIGTLYMSSTGVEYEATPIEAPTPMDVSVQDAQFSQLGIDPKQLAQGMKAFINTNPTYKEIINNPQFANSIGKVLKQYVNV